jgi:glutathione S-transferase
MRIYGHPRSTCTQKVLLTLAEKGAEAELVVVDLFEREHLGEPHRARHPFARIPVLEEGDFVLYESLAIMRYLDAHLPGPSLVPNALRERARMEQWISVAQSYVAPAVRGLLVERVLKPHSGQPPDEGALARATGELEHALAVVGGAFADGPYLVASAPSLADLTLFPYLAALDHLGAGASLSQRPGLTRFVAHMLARKSSSCLTEQ